MVSGRERYPAHQRAQIADIRENCFYQRNSEATDIGKAPGEVREVRQENVARQICCVGNFYKSQRNDRPVRHGGKVDVDLRLYVYFNI